MPHPSWLRTAAVASLVAVTLGVPVSQAQAAPNCASPTQLTLLHFNDFHGRLASASPDTVQFVGTIEELRTKSGDANTILLSGGDSVGASLFASFAQNDEPTLELLRAMGISASAAGNHEYDQGWPDLRDRIAPGVNFPYLAANVTDASGTSVLPAYTVIDKAGLKVGVVGAVTGDLPSLVSPAGLTGLTVGDPVAAVNKTIAQLKDGNAANGEADVIVVEYHEGAPAGASTSTLASNVATSPAFANIVNNTDARAQAIFNAHTHQVYAWDAPTGQRPIVQAGSYASNIGKVTLSVDPATGETCSYTKSVEPMSTTPVATLVTTYPRAAQAKQIVTQALATAQVIGTQVVGTASAPVTRALTTNANGSISDDRARESTLSNMVADMFKDTIGATNPDVIGMQNPGGTRADLDAGPITYAEAAAILPFANSLFTTQITGAQLKTVLEQQWQRDAKGVVPSRPYLQLGLSKNVTYTYDASRPEGDRITSISVNGAPVNTTKLYTVVSGSFLIAGGDNFHELAKGVNTADAGRADLEAWVTWLKAQGTVAPSFVKHAVSVHTLPATIQAGSTTTLAVGVPQDALALDTLNFKTNGVKNTKLTATFLQNGKTILAGTALVVDGKVPAVQVYVPRGVQKGAATLVLKALPTGTTVTIGINVTKAGGPVKG